MMFKSTTRETEDYTNERHFQLLLKTFIDNSYELFANTLDKGNYEQNLRGSVTQAINSQISYSKFIRGDFDEMIFSENPCITAELSAFIKNNNRAFVMRLFTKCSSADVLSFWLKNEVELPKDSMALAVMMHSKKFIFEYLHTNEAYWPREIDAKNKIELIKRASKSLDSESFEYLQEALGVQLSQIQYAKTSLV